MQDPKQRKRIIWAIVVVLLVAALWTPVRVIIDLLPAIPEARVMQQYNAGNEQNLKALRTALMEFHDSEGQFPAGASWMDNIKSRTRVDNMTQQETNKKFVNPLYPSKPTVFGYAINDAAAGKYKGDLKPGTILVFDSSDTAWNAHGDPAKLKPKSPYPGGLKAITVDGSIVKL
jgi:hypothetical protein